MSTTLAFPTLPAVVPYLPARFTVERYHELIALGAYDENDRVELLQGVIVQQMPKNPPHVTATALCNRAITRLLPPGWHPRVQDPITLADSEPEPDVAVVRGNLQDYRARHPGSADVALVVEVADTSLVTDRFKAEIYAQAGIPAYWIVNLADDAVEVHSGPVAANPARYSSCQTYRRGESIPLSLAGQVIGQAPVAELLP